MLKKIKETLIKINDFIDDSFFQDYHNWILWIPILFAFGILTFFKLKFTNIYIGYSLIYILIFFMIKYRNNEKILLFLLVFFIFFSGYIRTSYYVNKIRSPTVRYKMGYVKIYGKITDLSYYQKYGNLKKRIIVKVDKIEKYKKIEKNDRVRDEMTSYFSNDGIMHNLPKYVRININNKKYQPQFGDYVEVSGNLIPIPKQAFKGSYNMESSFYFQEIGAIAYNGYVNQFYKKDEKNLYNKIKNKTYNTREIINNRIIDAVGEKSGAMVGSFITGIRGKIDEEDYNNMTYAGLAHLIAISGLNMAIIMGLAFYVVRRILVQFEIFSLKLDIKKISAIFAIILGFLYLSITGFPVSANRAYIMSVLFFTGILMEKETDTMRFLCLAGFVLLFYKPNLVLEPSFQLSFFAVIGLISGFKIMKKYEIHTYTTNKFLKPFYYCFSIFVSSIISEISVTPIAIYHFNNYTPYNMLTNMIAIPLAGFITLPFATISILLFPFNLEKYLLIPAGWSINIILTISKYVVNLPKGVFIVPSPSIFGLSFIIFGFLWFCLWEQKWRYFGAFLFILGIIFSIFKEKPNFIIDKQDKFIILISKNGDLYFSNDKNKYKVSIIKKKFGRKYHNSLTEYCNLEKDIENCKNYTYEIKSIFKNKDILENFRNLNKKYKIFNQDIKVLIN